MDRREPRAQGLDTFFRAETHHACGMDIDSVPCEMFESLELQSECSGLRARKSGELLLAGPLEAHAHVEMGKLRKVPGVGFVMPDEDAVRLQDEEVPRRPASFCPPRYSCCRRAISSRCRAASPRR